MSIAGEKLAYLLQRPIAFHRVFVEIAGSVTAGLMLSQALYWSRSSQAVERDGWFYKNQEEWKDEIGLSRDEQETARRRLRQIGVLEEKKEGIPSRLWYRVDMDRLVQLVSDKYAEIPQTREGKSRRQENGKTPYPYNTETTAETTTESISDADASGIDDFGQFAEEFWKEYPARNGKKIGKALTLDRLKKTPRRDWPLVLQAVANYAESGQGPRDPLRFLQADYWKEWVDPSDGKFGEGREAREPSTNGKWANGNGYNGFGGKPRMSGAEEYMRRRGLVQDHEATTTGRHQ